MMRAPVEPSLGITGPVPTDGAASPDGAGDEGGDGITATSATNAASGTAEARSGRTVAAWRAGRAARGSGARVARLTRAEYRSGVDGDAAWAGERGWVLETTLGAADGMTAVAVTSPMTGTARRFHTSGGTGRRWRPCSRPGWRPCSRRCRPISRSGTRVSSLLARRSGKYA